MGGHVWQRDEGAGPRATDSGAVYAEPMERVSSEGRRAFVRLDVLA
jgi:hypothetical protein